jgi:hypothetical protein
MDMRRAEMALSVAKSQRFEEQFEYVATCINRINMFMLSPICDKAYDSEMRLRIGDMTTRVQNLRKSAIKAGMAPVAEKAAALLEALDFLAQAASD